MLQLSHSNQRQTLDTRDPYQIIRRPIAAAGAGGFASPISTDWQLVAHTRRVSHHTKTQDGKYAGVRGLFGVPPGRSNKQSWGPRSADPPFNCLHLWRSPANVICAALLPEIQVASLISCLLIMVTTTLGLFKLLFCSSIKKLPQKGGKQVKTKLGSERRDTLGKGIWSPPMAKRGCRDLGGWPRSPGFGSDFNIPPIPPQASAQVGSCSFKTVGCRLNPRISS